MDEAVITGRHLAGVQSTRFAFAACEGDGSVVSWGSPFAGGDTSEVEHELMDVQEVAANLMAFAAIRVDGSVVVWGHQSCGGQIDESLQAKLSENGGVRRIVTTDRAFAALKRDGSVVSWGCMYPSAQTPDLGTRRISLKLSQDLAAGRGRQDGRQAYGKDRGSRQPCMVMIILQLCFEHPLRRQLQRQTGKQ